MECNAGGRDAADSSKEISISDFSHFLSTPCTYEPVLGWRSRRRDAHTDTTWDVQYSSRNRRKDAIMRIESCFPAKLSSTSEEEPENKDDDYEGRWGSGRRPGQSFCRVLEYVLCSCKVVLQAMLLSVWRSDNQWRRRRGGGGGRKQRGLCLTR